ncbi:MAG TPA: TlpA disulfide reductase family protein [Thermoanaerobaculia bacterium]|nr:TlpA disulfide reductase family protein [Thermoanaerobaculia bacterium]HUM29623.1 TlpA disulfide reductase family protein [Thermoanaerobaculia bacterium]HXK67274.1 TlpA disulfide reductase family protein [Thermoanaerobaculia bacterium]
MKKLLLLLVIITFAIASFYFLNRSTGESTTSGTVQPGSGSSPSTSPNDFALESLEGKTVRLSDYDGKPVLVVFFATWCPPCRMEIPHLKKMHGDELVDILAVDIREPSSKVERFVKDQDIPYTVLLDEEGQVSNRFSVSSIPTTLLINPDGSIYKRITGFDPSIESIVSSWVNGRKSEA